MKTNNRVCSHAGHPDDGFPVIAICLECSLPWHQRMYGKVCIPAERPVRAEVVDMLKFHYSNRKTPRQQDTLVKRFARLRRQSVANVAQRYPYNLMMAQAERARPHVSNKHEAIVVGYLRAFKRHPLGTKAVPVNPIFGGAA